MPTLLYFLFMQIIPWRTRHLNKKIVKCMRSKSEWYSSLGSIICFLFVQSSVFYLFSHLCNQFYGGQGRVCDGNGLTHQPGVEWLSLPPGLLGSLVHRVQTQCSQISHWFKSVTGSTDSFQESLNTLKRDELNLRKLLVVATSSGKVRHFGA